MPAGKDGRPMSSSLDLAAVLAEVPDADIPGVLGQLEAVRAQLWSRLWAKTEPMPSPVPLEPERRVRVEEAAAIIGCSVRWLRQHGHTLPSYRRDLNGRRVTWLRSALLSWMQGNGA
jgi:hypothetical protein